MAEEHFWPPLCKFVRWQHCTLRLWTPELALVTRQPGICTALVGRLPRSTSRLTCTITMPPELWAAIACTGSYRDL